MLNIEQCYNCKQPILARRVSAVPMLCMQCAHVYDHPVVRARMRAFARRIVYGRYKEQLSA